MMQQITRSGIRRICSVNGIWAILSCLCIQFSGIAQVVTYPVPANEQKFDACQLQVNGNPVEIYACRVSKYPINQWWPGYQRPIEQTEIAGFAYWDMKGSVKIEITAKQAFKNVVIRPLSLGVKAEVAANKISFKLDSITPIVVEIDGYHNALHLFPNRIQDEKDIPKSPYIAETDAYTKSHNGAGNSNVCCPQCNYCSPRLTKFPDSKDVHFYYFAPGLHDIGTLRLKSNDSVYIAGGAVVYGCFISDDAENIRIWGRGILDGAHIQRADMRARAGFGCLHIRNSRKVSIKGIILRDPNSWGCNIRECQDVEVSDLKFIGFWRYNADGIDIWNSSDVCVDGCFIRAFDDSFVVRATDNTMKGIHFSNCVLWNDWGQSSVITARHHIKKIEDITFKNIDIIRAEVCALRLGNYNGADIRNIEYENINLEIDEWVPRQKMQKKENREERYIPKPEDKYCPSLIRVYIDEPSGIVENVTYRNIKVYGNTNTPSSFKGMDSEHRVNNILIKNLQFNDKVITDFKEANITVGKFVDNIKMEK